jgi:hypothetical protein
MVAVTQSANEGRTQAITTRSQTQPALPTLLGRQAPRIPVGGRIRAGIKVLTKKAEAHAGAREIYERGVAAGKGFEAIEKEIARAVPDLANPLVPRNVPYFTVRGEDFPNPELARQILQRFGEDRGEGHKLYRFPVVFPADAWQNVMPHEMVAWTASQKLYWSEYSADGQTRYCKTYAAVPVDGQGRRTVRIFGGRKEVLRAENEGRCEPESCPEYQSKRCNLTGRFIFYMPGIQSLSAFELPTTSFYAMQAAIEKFQTIGFMRGGRISGFLDGRNTPFFITKRLVEVSRIDEAGKATRVAQWLIELEGPIDVSGLLKHEDGLEAVERRAAESAAMLEGAPADGGNRAATSTVGVIVDVQASQQAMPIGSSEREPASDRAPTGAAQTATTSATTVSRGTGEARASRRPAEGAPAAPGEPPSDKALAWILDAAAALGVAAERFEQYADKRWGRGWKVAEGGRKRAIDELDAFAEDAKSFQAKVAGELEVWN